MWPGRMAALPPMGQWSVFGDHWLEVIWLLGCLLCEWAVCVRVCARECVYVCVPKALLPKGNGQGVIPMRTARRAGPDTEP